MRNLILIILLSIASTIYASNCHKLFDAKQYKIALSACTISANQGDADAQFVLGEMYSIGEGVKQNSKAAIGWYTKAANLGNEDAKVELGYIQRDLGNLYLYKSDYTQAFNWYTKAGDQGDPYAAIKIAEMYYLGIGVTKDYRQVLKWMAISLFDHLGVIAMCIIVSLLLCIALLIIWLINIFSRLKPNLNVTNFNTNKILAIIMISLILLQLFIFIFIASGSKLYYLGLVNLISFVIYCLFYSQFDKIFATKLTRLYIMQLLLSPILVVSILASLIYFESTLFEGPGFATLIMIVVIMSYIIFVCFPVITYKIGLNFNVIAKSTDNKWFKVSAIGMKVAACTMPILIGIFIFYIAHAIFIIGCIVDKTASQPI